MQETEMTERFLRIGYDLLLIRGSDKTTNELEKQAQIGALLRVPVSQRARVGRIEVRATVAIVAARRPQLVIQIKILTHDLDKAGLFEKALIRVVRLKQIDEQIETILDNNAATQHIALALDYLHDAIETGLESHNFLYIAVGLGQTDEEHDGVVSNDLATVVKQIDETRDAARYLQDLLLRLRNEIHDYLIEQLESAPARLKLKLIDQIEQEREVLEVFGEHLRELNRYVGRYLLRLDATAAAAAAASTATI